MTVIGKCGQVLKGVWWMSWHREATKDVEACDKLRGAGNQVSIRRFLNAETRWDDLPSPAAECIGRKERTQRHDLPLPSDEFIVGLEQTWGTETSKYLEEKKKTLIP